MTTHRAGVVENPRRDGIAAAVDIVVVCNFRLATELCEYLVEHSHLTERDAKTRKECRRAPESSMAICR